MHKFSLSILRDANRFGRMREMYLSWIAGLFYMQATHGRSLAGGSESRIGFLGLAYRQMLRHASGVSFSVLGTFGIPSIVLDDLAKEIGGGDHYERHDACSCVSWIFVLIRAKHSRY
jgi:hypothetical protein